jgi:hypothetical protein
MLFRLDHPDELMQGLPDDHLGEVQGVQQGAEPGDLSTPGRPPAGEAALIFCG